MFEPKIADKQMIERQFDNVATSYDRVASFYTQFGQRLAERLPIVPGTHLLDVATGTGAVLLPAAQRVGPDGHVTGIDLSTGILQEAKSIASAKGLTNVELRKMDAEHLELPDKDFDVVTCTFSLFLFPDMEAALHEIYRVCKPGGCFGVTVFSKPFFNPALPLVLQQFQEYQVDNLRPPHPLFYAPEEVEALLGRFRFNSIEIYSETNDIKYTNAEDWWAFLSMLVRPIIMGMNDETRKRFKEEYFTKLRPMFRQDGLHLSLAVIYALAKR
jgi:O-methyltransferase/aklanonic acid methyltransferase